MVAAAWRDVGGQGLLPGGGGGGARYWIFRRGDGVEEGTGDLSWHLHGVFG
jgi:hypothetical protein